jgi:hypothetical protein
MCPTGNARLILAKYAERVWRIPTDHFDPAAARRFRVQTIPLEHVLVRGSTYSSRSNLKRRLFEAGLKQRACEMCGQGEEWHGRHMSLILDHVNGVRDDHRLENLRILCPNCNATLETHCGRSARIPKEHRPCLACGAPFLPRYERHRYCSRDCGQRAPRPHTRPGARRVERPPYQELLALIAEVGYEGVGRRYGVSGNAIRKWRLAYEAEREAAVSPAAADGATVRQLNPPDVTPATARVGTAAL